MLSVPTKAPERKPMLLKGTQSPCGELIEKDDTCRR